MSHRSMFLSPIARAFATAANATFASALVFGAVATAKADTNPIGAGTLTCERVKGSGTNLIVHSTAEIRCVFKHKTGVEEHYRGETGVALGVELQWHDSDKLTFTVIGASVEGGKHALSGKYFGTRMAAAVAHGGGAKILIGGRDHRIQLKPAILQSKGFGASVGLGYMNLEPIKK